MAPSESLAAPQTPEAAPVPSTGRVSPIPQRLMAVDALRGFDMFWIIGGDKLGRALGDLGGTPTAKQWGDQFRHVPWEGFRFYDLIFPLFVFIVGVSLVFSLSKTIQREGRAAAVRRILFRSVALYLIGILYYHGIHEHGEQRLRLMGVLQRIALAYLFASLFFVFLDVRWMIVVAPAAINVVVVRSRAPTW